MPASYVTCPTITLPDHEITTEEIWKDIRKRNPNHPNLKIIKRVLNNTGVQTRRFVRPLAYFSAPGQLETRVPQGFFDALAMGITAAERALAEAGLTPHDIDGIVTSHTTSWGVPNMDVRLMQALGLRPDVRRLALTTLACAGGVQSLIRAHDLIQARPGSKILVVVPETPSSVYHHSDTSMDAMIWKGLFGDSAGACIVTDTPLSPGLRIDDTWEFVLPDSIGHYSGRLNHAGFHFDGKKEALLATRDVMPYLKQWTDGWVPDVPIIHPGSSRILTDVAEGLGIDPQAMRHSWESLKGSNKGGNAVLDILARTHREPPGDGSAFALAFGPGFATAAIRGRWIA
ncbi:PhlD [Streptomyces griseocarneus]|nr:PhlD [Streptomyces griseocarneus]